MAHEPEIIVRDREQLIALLTEAAEIEHGLMCCYLYAAFSLKTTPDSGLSSDQLLATRRWRSVIIDVAIEEMLHLGLVANLMAAIGATPHFSRPNVPVAPGYHPAGVVVEVARFCPETMDHFVFLERPEGIDLQDGATFAAPKTYERATKSDVLVPSAQDFHTVGHLYRAIGAGFAFLVDTLGTAAVFVGGPQAQMGPGISGFDKMVRVIDLASALEAIDAIVEQGEGSPGQTADSHYQRFCTVRDDYAIMRTAAPDFEPAWPCARNPVMRKPPTPEGKVHVSGVQAANLLDVGNAAYGLMLRCLMGAFGQPNSIDADRKRLYDAAISLMHSIVPLAEALARLPATETTAEPTAGLTFTLPRSITPVVDARLALRIIAERGQQIAAAYRKVSLANVSLAGPATAFTAVVMELVAASPVREPQLPVSASPSADPAHTLEALNAAANPLKPGNTTEEAVGETVTIRFVAKRCIHARFCVLQAPTVFKANTPGTWMFPDTMATAQLVAVAEACPSGAITYTRHDSQPDEAPPPVNVLRVRQNGPYAVHADVDLIGVGKMTRVTLCRCGASKNKPFCDGAHNDADFEATGEPVTRQSEPLPVRGERVTITPQLNGPLAISGSLEICSGTGRTIDRATAARLCRCGASSNKPYCDGSHRHVGFKSNS